jgi:2-methylisocitrate lyase-like PEP mutase family enzyme
MSIQQDKAQTFVALHVKSSPVILFNIWDAGSAVVVAEQGAKAIALGSHAVAEAYGYEDGENIPLDLVLENARRVVDAVNLPVTLDFEAGYGATADAVKASITRVLETGIIGVNIEDKMPHEDGLYAIDVQVARLQAVRAAATEAGIALAINARTDLFKEADPSEHSDSLLDQALERAQAFKDAGATSFFVPLITDVRLIKRLCDESPLPVNIIWLDGIGMPSPHEIAELGASRISYGPGPWLEMKEWLAEKARKSFEN